MQKLFNILEEKQTLSLHSVAREQRVFILQLVITLKQDTGRPLRFIQNLLRDHLDQRQITLHHRNVGNQTSVLV